MHCGARHMFCCVGICVGIVIAGSIVNSFVLLTEPKVAVHVQRLHIIISTLAQTVRCDSLPQRCGAATRSAACMAHMSIIIHEQPPAIQLHAAPDVICVPSLNELQSPDVVARCHLWLHLHLLPAHSSQAMSKPLCMFPSSLSNIIYLCHLIGNNSRWSRHTRQCLLLACQQSCSHVTKAAPVLACGLQ
jgi:hypothetical protein